MAAGSDAMRLPRELGCHTHRMSVEWARIEPEEGRFDDRVIARFERYVRHVVAELCDLVSDWVTINEPNVYLLEGYVLGEWPPGRRSVFAYLRGAKLMVRAHLAAYRAIHEVGSACGVRMRVGVAHHLREVAALVSRGVPIERYYHWSLIDNFEWLEGESARFGLVACDYPTQRRRVRDSGRLYASICRSGLVSPGDF